ncbi:hypothetical protein [Burkholderia vietnamiensis]|uniref:hypothetical protein n=1 Tax=Burkholderia vietnamiensis TaxID=60552 RepID=UPI001CF2680A|nr:hypothetical protein [Burkholderia vietnamiensis]MCA8195488.1 hypothetical protein [Burkholderia vietnamiensis]
MASIYARVLQGRIMEIIPPYTDPDGRDVPISERYTKEFVDQLVDITGINPMPSQGWGYDGKKFTAPA